MASEIPELHCHWHTVFCIGHNFETIISGEMLHTPTQCHIFMIYDDTGRDEHTEIFQSESNPNPQKVDPIQSWSTNFWNHKSDPVLIRPCRTMYFILPHEAK